MMASLFLLTAACSSSETKTTAIDVPGVQARGLAGAGSEIKVELPKAIEYIKAGVGYDIACKVGAQHDTPITLTFNNMNAPGFMTTDTTLLEFTRALRDIGVKSINAGNTNYQTRYGSLYRMNNGEHVRVYDFRTDLYSTCMGAGTSGGDEVLTDNYEAVTSVKSLVGPYASYMSSTSGYTEGAAHPWAAAYMTAVNSDDTKVSDKNSNTISAQPASLLDVVDNNSLAQAMRNDKFLQKRVGSSLRSAKDIKAVHKILQAKLNDCDIYVGSDINEFMSHFAIYDYQADGKVQVRLGMSYGCEAARGNYTELGLIVTPTAKFKALLEEEMATSRTEKRKPYFMKYLTKNGL